MDTTFRQKLIDLLWEHDIPQQLGQKRTARFLNALLRLICLREDTVVDDIVVRASSALRGARHVRRNASDN